MCPVHPASGVSRGGPSDTCALPNSSGALPKVRLRYSNRAVNHSNKAVTAFRETM